MPADGSVKIQILGDASSFEKTLKGIAAKSASLSLAGIAAAEAAMAAAAAAAIRYGTEFESASAKLETIVNASDGASKSIGDLEGELLALSNRTGQSAAGLAEVAYNAISAGTAVDDAAAMAGTASKLASAGFTSAESALSVLTTTMNAYGDSAGTAEEISDGLLTVQNLGVTTIDQLASSMGKAIATASAYGVDLHNLESSYISLTKAGISTEESTTYLSSMLNELGDSGSDVGKILQEQTGKTFGELMNEGGDLSEVLGILNEYVDGNSEALMNLWGSAEAGKASAAIVGQGLSTFQDNLDAVKNSAGATEKAYETMTDTLSFQTDLLKTNAQNFAILVYQGMEEPLKSLASYGVDAIDTLTAAFQSGGLSGAAKAFGQIVGDLVAEGAAQMPKLASLGGELLVSLVQGLADNADRIVQGGVDTVKLLAQTILEEAPALADAGHELFDALLDGADDLVPQLKPVTALLETMADHFDLVLFSLKPLLTATIAYRSAVQIQTVVQTATKALHGMTVAQWALNTAMNANPIGILVAGIAAVGGLIWAFESLMAKQQKEREALGELSEEQQQLTDRIQETNDAYQETMQTRTESLAAVDAEYGHLESLKTELGTLVDANGQVKKGYESRVDFILNELSEATGLELDRNKLLEEGYQSLCGEIDNLIQKKRAEASLSAMDDSYEEAIQNQTQAINDYTSAKQELEQVQKQLAFSQDVLEKAQSGEWDLHTQEIEEISTNVDALTLKEQELSEAFSTAESILVGYNTTIQNYEGLSAAIISGDVEEIAAALEQATANFQTAETGTKETLAQQVTNLETAYEEMKAALEAGAPGVTQEMVDNAAEMVERAKEEYQKLTDAGAQAGTNSVEAAAEGVQNSSDTLTQSVEQTTAEAASGFDDLETEASQAADDALNTAGATMQENTALGDAAAQKSGEVENEFSNIDVSNVGTNMIQALSAKLTTMVSDAQVAGIQAVTAMMTGMASQSEALTQEAALLVETIASGILSRQALVLQRGQSIARQLQRAMKLISFVPVGKQYMSGVASGLSSGSGTVYSRVRAIARGMVNAMKAELDIHSPSRVTRKEIGPDFLRGIPAGMEDALPEAEQSIADSTAAMVARAKQTVNAQLQNASFRSAGVSLVDERIQQHNGSDEKVIAWLQRIEHAVRAGAVLTVDGRVLGQTSLKYQQKMSRVTGR